MILSRNHFYDSRQRLTFFSSLFFLIYYTQEVRKRTENILIICFPSQWNKRGYRQVSITLRLVDSRYTTVELYREMAVAQKSNNCWFLQLLFECTSLFFVAASLSWRRERKHFPPSGCKLEKVCNKELTIKTFPFNRFGSTATELNCSKHSNKSLWFNSGVPPGLHLCIQKWDPWSIFRKLHFRGVNEISPTHCWKCQKVLSLSPFTFHTLFKLC